VWNNFIIILFLRVIYIFCKYLFNFLKLYSSVKITNFFKIKLTTWTTFILIYVIFTFSTCSFLRNLLISNIYFLNNYFVFFLFSFCDVLTFIKILTVNSSHFNWLNSQSLEYIMYTILIHFNLFFKNLFLLNYSYVVTFYLDIFISYKISIINTFFNYVTRALYYLDNLYVYISSNSTRFNSMYYILFIFTFFILLFLFVEFKKISLFLTMGYIKNKYFSEKKYFFQTKYIYFFKKNK